MNSIDKIITSQSTSINSKPLIKKKLQPIINRKNLQRINNNRLLKINRSCIDLSTKKLDKYQNNQKNNNNSNNKLKINPIRKKELSVLIFQNNDVDIVRSLDPDIDKNICNNLLFKEYLKNNIDNNSQNSLDLPNEMLGQKIHLPLLKTITINGILESEKKLNQNKKETQRNLANSQLEEDLYNNLKNINNQYTTKKTKRDGIYESYKTDIKEIEELKMDIKILNGDYNIPYNNSNKLKNSPKNEFDFDEDIIPKQIIEKKKENLMQKEQKDVKLEKVNRLELLKHIIQQKLIDITNIDKELDELKIKKKIFINKLMEHYETLLYKGRDVRNEGLIWIIKSIWSLGRNVPMSFIPTFLDFSSIEFLFKFAHKSIKLENYKKLLNDFKKKLQIKLHNIFFNNLNNNSRVNTNNSQHSNNLFNDQNKEFAIKHLLKENKSRKNLLVENTRDLNRRSSFVFKTNLLKFNSVLRRSISQHNFIKSYIHSNEDEEQDNNKLNHLKGINYYKDISKFLKYSEYHNEGINIEKLAEISDIKNIRKTIKEIEDEIVILKKNEINRIFKEFIENDYQNKYHVPIDVVLAALIGEHGKNLEYNRFLRFKKEYFDKIKGIRFFDYSRNKDST